jgi:hypothetical protein
MQERSAIVRFYASSVKAYVTVAAMLIVTAVTYIAVHAFRTLPPPPWRGAKDLKAQAAEVAQLAGKLNAKVDGMREKRRSVGTSPGGAVASSAIKLFTGGLA